MSPDGQPETVTPEDVREMRAFVSANRTLTTPFDMVMGGTTNGRDRAQQEAQLRPWLEAGVTWWVESLWDASEETAAERIQQGPPTLT